MSKTAKPELTEANLDVAAALIVRKDGKILTVYNDKWGAFTLPMTKPRRYTDDNGELLHAESLENAAARAAVEVLGAPCFVSPVDIRIDSTRMKGRRDGRVKQYRYHVFKVAYDLSGPPAAENGGLICWLSPSQITAPPRSALRPISTSAYLLVTCIRLNAPGALKSGIDMGD